MPKPPTPATQDVPSPCIQICTLDARGLCTGCLRSIGEIAEWGGASTQQKRMILDRVAQRRSIRDRRA